QAILKAFGGREAQSRIGIPFPWDDGDGGRNDLRSHQTDLLAECVCQGLLEWRRRRFRSLQTTAAPCDEGGSAADTSTDRAVHRLEQQTDPLAAIRHQSVRLIAAVATRTSALPA